MRFYMGKLYTFCFAECQQCSDLIFGIGFCLLVGDCHISAAKSHQVRESGMSTDAHLMLLRHFNRLFHDYRIGCMISAGNIC